MGSQLKNGDAIGAIKTGGAGLGGIGGSEAGMGIGALAPPPFDAITVPTLGLIGSFGGAEFGSWALPQIVILPTDSAYTQGQIYTPYPY